MYYIDGNGQLVLAGEYETAGDGEEVGAAPLTAFRQLAARPAAGKAAPARALPAGFRPVAAAPMFQPQAAAGVTEPRARQITREEIQNALASMPALSGAMQIPAKPVDGENMQPLGLNVVTFTNTSGTTLTLSAKPQRGFRGERLVLDIRRVGPTAIASPVILSRFAIGDLNQLVGGGALPADIFAADAFGVRLMMDAAFPGVNVDLTFTIPAALGVGDSIFVSGGIIGRTTDITK